MVSAQHHGTIADEEKPCLLENLLKESDVRVVLADPPKNERGYNLTYPSLALTHLIGYARDYFAEAEHSFHYLEGFCNIKEHLAALRELKPDFYGTTVAAITSELAYQTIKAVRREHPALPIVCGGPHPTAMPEDVLASSSADVCVRGEGEITFVELLEHFSGQGKELSEIKGIAYRDQNGGTVLTAKRPYIKQLDALPFPAWDLVKDFSAYSGMHFRRASPQSYVLCSRGCPFDCNFCSNPVWKENKPWVRLRGPEKIAQEVEWLYRLGVREIYLGADEFNVSEAWAEEVCDRIAALDCRNNLYFHIDARADKMTPRLAQKLAGINVWLAHLGIETGSQRTLDGIGKKVTLEQITEACRMMRSAGISVFGFIMLFHAWEDKESNLCWETAADVDRTISFAKNLFREGLIQYCSWQVATPWPGSRLWQTALRHNLIADRTAYHGIRTMAMNLPGVSEADIRRAVRRGVWLKTFHALKAGNLNWSETWRRGIESVKNMAGIGTLGGTR